MSAIATHARPGSTLTKPEIVSRLKVAAHVRARGGSWEAAAEQLGMPTGELEALAAEFGNAYSRIYDRAWAQVLTDTMSEALAALRTIQQSKTESVSFRAASLICRIDMARRRDQEKLHARRTRIRQRRHQEMVAAELRVPSYSRLRSEAAPVSRRPDAPQPAPRPQPQPQPRPAAAASPAPASTAAPPAANLPRTPAERPRASTLLDRRARWIPLALRQHAHH